jgi:hypothetical protein
MRIKAAIAKVAGVAGKPMEAVCTDPSAYCEPVDAEDVGRGSSLE